VKFFCDCLTFFLLGPNSVDIRKKIFSIPYVEWKKRGFSKGTLHHLKKQADGDKPFYLQKQVMTQLDQWDQTVDQCGSTVDGMD
jgi:CRISP-associated protein Cas1